VSFLLQARDGLQALDEQVKIPLLKETRVQSEGGGLRRQVIDVQVQELGANVRCHLVLYFVELNGRAGPVARLVVRQLMLLVRFQDLFICTQQVEKLSRGLGAHNPK